MAVTRARSEVRRSAADRAEGLSERARRPGSRPRSPRSGPSLRAPGPLGDGAAGLRSSRAGRFIDRRRPLGGPRLLEGAPCLARRAKEEENVRFGTAAVPKAALRSRRRFERHPGRLIPHDDHMGLDNYPVPCECGKHTRRSGIPDGLTHREKEPCPFKDENFPIGMLGSCCWLRGKVAAYELDALHERQLCERMFQNMTAEEAFSFALELDAAADRLERQHAGDAEKPRGAPWNGRLNERNEWVWETFSTFETALASIREAARWYRKIGLLGFGVHAWY